MAKLTFNIRLLDDDGKIAETAGVYDLDTAHGNVHQLVLRLYTLFRRELIRRALIEPTAEDTKR